MRQSLRLGRVAGIPVGVNWSVVIIVGLLIGLGAAELILWDGTGGLWLMVVGIFLITAASAEAAAQTAAEEGTCPSVNVGGSWSVWTAHPRRCRP
jgi:hypothetical protein